MKIGDRVTYTSALGNMKGTVIHSNKLKTVVELRDDIYGTTRTTVPTRQLYRNKN